MEFTPLCSLRRQAPAVPDSYIRCLYVAGNRRKTKKSSEASSEDEEAKKPPAPGSHSLGTQRIHREASVLTTKKIGDQLRQTNLG
ncbi:hypothetical protein PGT21_010999 [Puccinia graminis f. sp. tritici]|uniref:Uncharacterized protein n=1 Tax=Puccinia graminis f. sp. tritici TaxID=56615 RepID=A0A5B0LU50_PUCGR|nr:hypothetical protein PGT21_010999 [Puccinia graminis f. sp. tritici]KAA1092157.1 hypothetical protein PGTUg99_009804 [Puccinia graminis f. sp. tritici]